MKAPPISSSTEGQTSSKKHQRSSLTSILIRLCAIGLLVSFFLPWIQFFGQGLSGFDLQKMRGHQKWLWIIPIFSVITIFVPAVGHCRKIAGLLTGALPFLTLGYGLSQIGGDLMKLLHIGAYAGLALGLLLFILSLRLK